jgi:hypothetical protein
MFGEMLSGLWHQTHRRGHPLKKTVVRIPGPSWSENLRISKIIPFMKNGALLVKNGY